MRPRLTAVACSILVIASREAIAAPDEAQRAERLYEEGVALVDKGDFVGACPKFEESQKLDPALGTQFNLADCWERTGRSASAFKLFSQVAVAARAAGKTKLETRASERASALLGRVGRVRVVVRPVRADAVVRIDREAVSAADATSGAPVDAGKHVVEVIAPGTKAWSHEVGVADGETVDVLAALEVAREVVRISDQPPPTRRDPTFRIAGAVAAGAGVVGVVVGSAFGLSALSKRGDARTTCGDPDPAHCHDPAGLDAWSNAKSAGTASTIAFVAGGVLLAGGAVLWFVAPSIPERRVAVGVSPTAGGAAFGLGGAF